MPLAALLTCWAASLAWVATLFGYSVWTRLLTRYPANQVAPFSLLVPVVGLTTGWVVYGEAMQPVHFAGAALLMLGLAVLGLACKFNSSGAVGATPGCGGLTRSVGLGAGA